mgnify:CR=1 FL=1
MIHRAAMTVGIAEDGGGDLGRIAGIQECGRAVAGRDEQLMMVGDVDSVRGDCAVQVLGEKSAPQNGGVRDVLAQSGFDGEVRDEACAVGTQDRDVDDVAAARGGGRGDERDDRGTGGAIGRQREQQKHPVQAL